MKNSLLTFLLLLFSTVFVAGQEIGFASFYSKRLHGRHTSDGGKYHSDSLTCAHKTYPFGTLLRVQNPRNNNEVIVKVTDRGPHTRNRLIDLSYSAAAELDIIRAGIAKVIVTKIDVLPEPIRLIPIPKTNVQVSPIRFFSQDLHFMIYKPTQTTAPTQLKKKKLLKRK